MDEMTDNRVINELLKCPVCEKVTQHLNGKCRECTLREAAKPKIGDWMTTIETHKAFFVAGAMSIATGFDTKGWDMLLDLYDNMHMEKSCRPATQEEIEAAVKQMILAR